MDSHYIKTKLVRVMNVMVVLAITLSVSMVAHAAPPSPFVGHWQAIDLDGSDIRLIISGPPNGPYQITWTESYISFCDGRPGIIRGVGWLNEGDANLLEADLHVECFTTGASLDFHLAWRYHPMSNKLSSRDGNGVVTIWHRSGNGRVDEPPALGLRVNYGHDWVESFYEGGHTAWVTITDGDGNLKATTELITEPKDYWGGETGFQSMASGWFDSEGNPMEYPPDIQPNDWVYGWVDNGASAQVQIGDISGAVHLADDFIEGTIYAPWFADPVQVECLDWGSGQETSYENIDGGSILANGSESYSCSWFGEWDIKPYQDVGVGYFGPDSHWVANVITPSNPRIVASEAGDWFWVTDFNVGTLDLFLYEAADEGAALLWSGTVDVTDTGGITFVGFDIHGQDLLPDNFLVVSDGVNSKGLVLEPITIDVFDTENEIMSGTALPGREVTVGAGPQEWQEHIGVQADLMTGAWFADFKTIGFDITEDMRLWSYASVFDEDGDANEGSTPPLINTRFTVWPGWNYLEGYEWPDGAVVSISVDGKVECSTEAVSRFPEGDPSNTFFSLNFPEDCDIGAGDSITLSAESLSFIHQVQELAITDVDLDLHTVAGTADFDPEQYLLHTWIHGVDGSYIQLSAEGGAWLADFGSLELDLQPGMGGRVELVDQASNATAVEWNTPPAMSLRVNYGHDWVESFYEAGHAVSIQVTDSEGNVKATSELMTEPKDYWGGETGFQSFDSVWFDGDGNQMENAPDLQSYDWVYAQVDNGVTAQVQLGDIQGEVYFQMDSVMGTILADWLSDPVQVECLDWGSGTDTINKDAGFVSPDGVNTYTCNWDSETEWDVQPWQDIGVGYSTPDGHWVANAFRDERWMAFWTYTPDPPTGFFAEGDHSYYYQWAYTAPISDSGISGLRAITIAGDPTPIYDWYALIGPWGLYYPGSFRPQLAWTGSACEEVSVLHPNQSMRFVWGWVNDYSMTYEEALTHFSSFTIDVFWDFFSDGITDGSATLATMSELIPFTGRDARFEYLCTLTEHP